MSPPKPPPKLEPKKEDGYNRLKVTIKEDVLKRSCAEEVLKGPLLTAAEETKLKSKRDRMETWKPGAPYN